MKVFTDSWVCVHYRRKYMLVTQSRNNKDVSLKMLKGKCGGPETTPVWHLEDDLTQINSPLSCLYNWAVEG